MAGILFDVEAYLKPRKDLEDLQRMRAWIINAFASTEYILTDFIMRAQAIEPCSSKWSSVPRDFKRRSDRAKEILNLVECDEDGNLVAHLDELYENYDTRNLLAHGIFQAPVAYKEGDRFVFRKWSSVASEPIEVTQSFTLAELTDIADRFGVVAESLMRAMSSAYDRLGWLGGSIFDDTKS